MEETSMPGVPSTGDADVDFLILVICFFLVMFGDRDNKNN